MTIYLVAYDLVKESSGRDYEPLWDELKRLDGHKTQYSLWLLDVSNTAKEVVEHFKKYVDSNDRIWASRVTKDHFYVNAMPGTNDWLSKHPPT
jgi:hypothetical protein